MSFRQSDFPLEEIRQRAKRSWLSSQTMPTETVDALVAEIDRLEEVRHWVFLQDVVAFARMFYTDNVRGEELQDEMLAKYPPAWMEWLFREVGWFGEEDKCPR